MNNPKCLCALLFHNDEDIIEDQIIYYMNNKQDLIIFNHNSNDNTDNIIRKYKSVFIKYYRLDCNIIFKINGVHETVSKILLGESVKYNSIEIYNPISDTFTGMTIDDNNNYTKKYDWISFPESDEFLEGPTRDINYYQYICEIHSTHKKTIQFHNFVFWFTAKDDANICSPTKRIRHYAYFKNCGPRIYAWRADLTNIRWFGHNLPNNCLNKDIAYGKTRHYDARSNDQFLKKAFDRKDVAIGGQNYHYTTRFNNIEKNNEFGTIDPSQLHYDNGTDELIYDDKFDWLSIY